MTDVHNGDWDAETPDDIAQLFEQAALTIIPSDELRSEITQLASADRPSAEPAVPNARPRLLAAAVAAVAVSGGALAFAVARPDSTEIEATEPTSVTTITTATVATTEPEVLVAGERPNLLPDPERWVAVEGFESSFAPTDSSPGVWAWAIDDGVAILTSVDDASAQPEARADARPEALHNRVTMFWVDAGTRFGFQGIDIEADRLQSLAADLRADGDQWLLDGAGVLAAEPPRPGLGGETHQVDFAPTDRVLEDRAIVSATTGLGSAAAMFGELFEASSIGTVTPITIAAQPGYLIEGAEVSYALVAADGWVTSWQTLEPNGLADFVASLRGGTDAEFQAALISGQQVRLDAISAAAAEIGTEDDYVADLPRFVLPPPWQPEWVTDMGIWTAEQRAQRKAQFAQNQVFEAPEGLWTQGFRMAGGDGSTAPSDVIVAVSARTPDIWINEERTAGEGSAAEPYSLAGLTGHLQNDFVYGYWQIIVLNENHVVTISSRTSDPDALRAFADTLQPRPAGLEQGFVTTGDYELTFEHGGAIEWSTDAVTRWVSAWNGEGESRATLSVAEVTAAEFHRNLFYDILTPGTSVEVIDDDTNATTYRTVLDEDELAEFGISLDNGPHYPIATYDPTTGLLVAVSTTISFEETQALLDNLEPVDLETWRELAEPINADPLKPR